jgi:DNA replication protein DnaC
MTTIAAELRIRTHAKRLRLPLVASQAVRYAEEAAAARHDHLEFLAALLDAEVAQRDVNVERARIIQARFPELKELSDFNFSLVPSLNAPLVSDLARCSFIDRREVVLAVGPPGTGKTHTAIGLGLAACRRGKRVRFVTVAELVTELAEAQAEHRLSRLEEQLDRTDLLVCDELGFLRLDADQAQLLFILLAHRYTRGGLILYVIWNLVACRLSWEEGARGRNPSLWTVWTRWTTGRSVTCVPARSAGRCSRSIPRRSTGCASSRISAWRRARSMPTAALSPTT